MQDMAFQRVQFSKIFIYNFYIFSREIYGERQYRFLRRKTRNTFLVLQGPKALATLARLLKRKGFKVRKNTSKVCSNYFKYERPVDNHPHSTLFLKGYDREIVTRKRKAPMERLLVQPTTSNEKKSDTDSKQRVNIELILILWTFGRHWYGLSLYISREKAIIITSKHGTTILFPLQSYSTKPLRKIAPKSAHSYWASISDRAHRAHNTS